MKTPLIALAAMFLPACAIFDTPFAPEYDRGPNVKIEYVYVDHERELLTLCGKSTHSENGKKLLGCAFVPPKPDGACVVVLYRDRLPDVKEHEERHCRYGKWHL